MLHKLNFKIKVKIYLHKKLRKNKVKQTQINQEGKKSNKATTPTTKTNKANQEKKRNK